MKNHVTLVATICVLGTMLLPSACHSRTWHVRQDGTGDTVYLDQGLALAQPGDTVLVGPGRYQQPMIELGPVHLISESGPLVTSIELLVLDIERDVIVIAIGWVSDCSVIGFTIEGARNGMMSCGGGIDCLESSALIKNNIIIDNWCSSGGGICCTGSPSPTIEGNLIIGNGAFAGAAIRVSNSSPNIRNNTIVDNHAGDGGGAFYIFGDQSFPVIEDNIITGNSSGAILCYTPADQITFRCNDVWGNTPSNYEGTLPDQMGLNGNISEDPLFCGVAGSGNYYLRSSSPCAEGQVPASCNNARMGCYPVTCTVAVEKNSLGRIKSLFREGKR